MQKISMSASRPSNQWKFAGTAIAGLIAIVVAAVVLDYYSQKPDLVASLTAIGTIGTATLSMAFAQSTRRTSLEQRQSESRDRQDRAFRETAENVHAWIEPCSAHSAIRERIRRGDEVPHELAMDHCWGSQLVIDNRSVFPIHTFRLVSLDYAVLKEDELRVRTIPASSRGVLHLSAAGEASQGRRGAITRPYIAFSDQASNIWRRHEGGRLEAVVGPPEQIDSEADDALERQANRFEALQEGEAIRRRATHLQTYVSKYSDPFPDDWLLRSDALAFEELGQPRSTAAYLLGRSWYQWRGKKIGAGEFQKVLHSIRQGHADLPGWPDVVTRRVATEPEYQEPSVPDEYRADAT